MDDRRGPTRRHILVSGALAAGLELIAARPGSAQELTPTPACDDGDASPPPQTEGPYFKPRSPERADLRERGGAGTPLDIKGYVLTRRCQPVVRALLDLWQADERGEYDNRGFRYRGHQYTDSSGAFHIRTIVPAQYPGRTRHLHFKVQAPRGRVLTTQLYFPDEPANRRDGLFRRELVMRVARAADGRAASFVFVLDVG
jgi:protocatechuate 3,4-dioxygenase beta subunit